MICKHCEEKSCVFTLSCLGCRTRLALDFDCKYQRKIVVEDMERRYGEVYNWMVGGCDCKGWCKRKAAVKIEQSAYAERKEALIRDQRNELRSMRRTGAK